MVAIRKAVKFSLFVILALVLLIPDLPQRLLIAIAAVLFAVAGYAVLKKKYYRAPLYVAAALIVIALMAGIQSILLVALLLFALMVDYFM